MREITIVSELNEIIRENNHKTIIIEFSASWCSPCKLLKPKVIEWSSRRDDVVVVGVDAEEGFDLTSVYKVRNVPVLVFLKDGIEVDRSVGVVSEETLDEIMNKINTTNAN